MKYIKEIGLVLAGASVGFIVGGFSVVTAELKCKTIRTAFVKVVADKITDVMVGPPEREHYKTPLSYYDYKRCQKGS